MHFIIIIILYAGKIQFSNLRSTTMGSQESNLKVNGLIFAGIIFLRMIFQTDKFSNPCVDKMHNAHNPFHMENCLYMADLTDFHSIPLQVSSF